MLFNFEADFADTLQCIPMIVRWKLDQCGIKLKLHHWLKFSLEQKQWLITNPVSPSYAQQLQAWVVTLTGTPAGNQPIPDSFDWQNPHQIPAPLQSQITQLGLPQLHLDQWRQITELQRFALIKLTSPHHENRNFLPALIEFGLVDKGTI